MTGVAAFKWPIGASVAVLAVIGWISGPDAVLTVAILAALELSLSMDNAVVNAKVLAKMTEVWQRRFLGWGIIVAVFGMRAVFPLAIVSLVAWISPWAAVTMAITDPDQYGTTLTSAHPAVVGFGGAFLAMVFFAWLADHRDIHWIAVLERPLHRLGQIESSAVISTSVLLLAVVALVAPEHDQFTVLASGVAGIITHLAVNGTAAHFLDTSGGAAKAGAALFVYIEVLDASFSFDGVIGAFAITNQFLLITAGTGIGAFFVRAATIKMLREGTLQTYAHLEHGAHWAIGSLAVLLLLTIRYEIPESVTGMVGAGFVLASVATSILTRRAPGERVTDKTPLETS